MPTVRVYVSLTFFSPKITRIDINRSNNVDGFFNGEEEESKLTMDMGMMIIESWSEFVSCTETLIKGNGDLSAGSKLTPLVATLCSHGLAFLAVDHFPLSLEETFKKNAVVKFWQQFDGYCDVPRSDARADWDEEVITISLDGICSERSYLEKCLLILVYAIQSHDGIQTKGKTEFQQLQSNPISRCQLMVSSVLLTTLPLHFQGCDIASAIDVARAQLIEIYDGNHAFFLQI